MNRKILAGLPRRAAAFALAAVLAMPTAWAAAGEEKLQTSVGLADGLTYRNTITVNNSSRTESFSLELEEDSGGAYPILLQSAGTVYGAASINLAVSRAQEMGLRVLGAVNTDFFSTATGIPLGIVLEDGVYKSCTENERALLLVDGRPVLCEEPRVELSLTNEETGEIVVPSYFNKNRLDGGVYLLNRDFSTVSTHTSTPGWYVRMEVTGGESEGWQPKDRDELPPLTVNSALELEVTELIQSEEPLVIGENEYILTAADAAGRTGVYESFQVGDRVTLTTVCEDEDLSRAQWAGGVGDLLVWDGEIADRSGWAFPTGRAPRSALGVKEDGTLVLYAVDGRQSGYSLGLTELDLAEEMLARGCRWAVNLDGGGSTAMAVQLPGQAATTVKNLPSDGRPRGCATFLLLVSDEPGDGRPHRLALAEDGLTVLTGSSVTLPQALVLDDGLNVLDRTADDLTVTSQEDLGYIEDGVYHAGDRPGTDTLTLRSRRLGIEGTAQIHIVDALTDFTVSREGASAPLESLAVKPDEAVQLTASGSYWSRSALRSSEGVLWTVSEEAGTIDETGLFTASQNGEGGTITAEAGGLTRTVSLSKTHVFLDVPEDHWGHGAVQFCYDNDIVGGISATEFGPNNTVSRGDFILIIYHAAGSPEVQSDTTFTDVSPDAYYYDAISWAQETGLVAGVGDGLCRPGDTLTREQAFTLMVQAMPYLGKTCPVGNISALDRFSDRAQIAPYAVGCTATLVCQGVVGGSGGAIIPTRELSRVEVAALVQNLLTFTPVEVPQPEPQEPEPQEPEPQEPEPQEPDPQQPEQPQQALTLSQSDLTLNGGESFVLSAALTPAEEGAQVAWSADSPLVAVSDTGVVTNLNTTGAAAEAVVTASWNGLTARCSVHCQPAQSVGQVVDAELGLRVRSGPGTENAILDKLDNSTEVIVLKEDGGWYQILYRNKSGQAAVGYISGDYLELK